MLIYSQMFLNYVRGSMRSVYSLLKKKSEMRDVWHTIYGLYLGKFCIKLTALLWYVVLLAFKERKRSKNEVRERKLMWRKCSHISQTGNHRRFVYMPEWRIISSNWFKGKALNHTKWEIRKWLKLHSLSTLLSFLREKPYVMSVKANLIYTK